MMSRQRTELTKATMKGVARWAGPQKTQVFQWSFLVPLNRWYVAYNHPNGIYTQLVYTANWVIIYHLPPIKGTRNSYWFLGFTRLTRSVGYLLTMVVNHLYTKLGGDNSSHHFLFSPLYTWENGIQIDTYFSGGLKPQVFIESRSSIYALTK